MRYAVGLSPEVRSEALKGDQAVTLEMRLPISPEESRAFWHTVASARVLDERPEEFEVYDSRERRRLGDTDVLLGCAFWSCGLAAARVVAAYERAQGHRIVLVRDCQRDDAEEWVVLSTRTWESMRGVGSAWAEWCASEGESPFERDESVVGE